LYVPIAQDGRLMSQQSQTQTETREQHYQHLEKVQRQQTRRYILLPFGFLLLILVVIVGIVFSLRTPTQVAIVSDFLLTVFVLCPLVICMFPFAVLMLMLVALMNRLHDGTKSPLRRVEQWTYKVEKQMEGWVSIVDSRVLNWAVKFAPFRRILTIFDAPSSYNSNQDGGENNDQSRTDK
jgi:membrane protein implicated in regulation of membrane protease activity